MIECDKPLTPPGSRKRPPVPVIIGWVKTVWEHIPVEMVHKSYLKCGISNKMDGTKDDALYKDFLGKGVAKTEDVADNDGYTDYYDDSPATYEIPDYGWASFFMDDENDSDFEGF